MTSEINKPNYSYRAKIIRVVDGDTVDADIDLGFKVTSHQRLRLARIDTPELNSKDPQVRQNAVDATEFVRSKILNQTVFVVTTKSDLYGRYLAEIFYVDSEDQVQKNLCDQLLETKHAILY